MAVKENLLRAAKARCGRRVTLMGGVDALEVMTRGTPETAESKVKAAIDSLGPGGGLDLQPDQRVAMPEENLRVLVEAAPLYGRYGRGGGGASRAVGAEASPGAASAFS